MWLGQADPVDTVSQLASVDPAREQRGTVFAAIASVAGGWPNGFTVNELARKSETELALRTALETVARGKTDATAAISNERLGWWLRRNDNRIAGGFKLTRGEERGKAALWYVAPAGQ